jgi:hypothetical protein
MLALLFAFLASGVMPLHIAGGTAPATVSPAPVGGVTAMDVGGGAPG